MSEPSFREQCRKFRELCIWTSYCYGVFETLFGSQERLQRVTRGPDGAIFLALLMILAEYFILQICKLTDPPGSRKRKNLSCRGLNAGLREAGLLTGEMETLAAALCDHRRSLAEVRKHVD